MVVRPFSQTTKIRQKIFLILGEDSVDGIGCIAAHIICIIYVDMLDSCDGVP